MSVRMVALITPCNTESLLNETTVLRIPTSTTFVEARDWAINYVETNHNQFVAVEVAMLLGMPIYLGKRQ